MLLAWVSEVHWDPELDQPQERKVEAPVAKAPARRTVRTHSDSVDTAAPMVAAGEAW